MFGTSLLSGFQLGPVGTWVGAVVTLLVVGIPATLIGRQARLIRTQLRALIDAQAHRVTVWADTETYEVENLGACRNAHVVNNADEPVFQCALDILDPENVNNAPIRTRMRWCLLPGETWKQSIPARGGIPWIKLGFKDSRGNYWVRDSQGELRKVGILPSAIYVGGPPGMQPGMHQITALAY